MRLRSWLITKLAEVWGFDMLGIIFALLVSFVLAILDRTDGMLVFIAVAAFFLGFFVSRQVYTPQDEKPSLGLAPMTADEFEEFKHGRR